ALATAAYPPSVARGLPGTNFHPLDQAVAPPNTDSFSTTTTLRPCHAAVTAAARPEAPEPTTSRSQLIRFGPVASIGVIITPCERLSAKWPRSSHRRVARARASSQPAHGVRARWRRRTLPP